MSNIEHLLENAIAEVREGHNINDFKALWHTREMLKLVNATIEEIWEMAIYVVYTKCQNCDCWEVKN